MSEELSNEFNQFLRLKYDTIRYLDDDLNIKLKLPILINLIEYFNKIINKIRNINVTEIGDKIFTDTSFFDKDFLFSHNKKDLIDLEISITKKTK